ncbi:MAG: tetratricopeptide repeat protein [Pseudomonadota bacterium]
MSTPQAMLKGVQLFQQAQQLHGERQYGKAAELYRQAMNLLPAHPGIVAGYARLAEDVKDWSAAEKLYRHLLDVKPDARCEPWLGHVLLQQGQADAAWPLLSSGLALNPDHADLLWINGLCASKLKRWEDVIDLGRRLQRVRDNAQAMDLLLNGLFNLGRRDELDALLENALSRFPDNPQVLGLCGVHLLKKGEFARGFALQRAIRMRYDHNPPADLHKPAPDEWDGKPFDGTLLIAGEQGLGEEILASCMLSDIVQMGQPAVVECEPRLLPLFRRSWPTLEFVPRFAGELTRRTASGQPFRRVRCLDLAHFLRRQDPLPPQPAWLVPDPVRREGLRAQYRQRFGNRRLIGISWRSHRAFHNGPDKSVPLSALQPLLARTDVAWIDVQYGDVGDDLAALDAAGIARPWRDAGIDATTDLDGLAAQLLALDMVVSVSNSTVHVAGACGAPGLVMLPKTRPVLWYWGYERDGTPWYPSLQLLRNTTENDWQDLVMQIGQRITEGT